MMDTLLQLSEKIKTQQAEIERLRKLFTQIYGTACGGEHRSDMRMVDRMLAVASLALEALNQEGKE